MLYYNIVIMQQNPNTAKHQYHKSAIHYYYITLISQNNKTTIVQCRITPIHHCSKTTIHQRSKTALHQCCNTSLSHYIKLPISSAFLPRLFAHVSEKSYLCISEATHRQATGNPTARRVYANRNSKLCFCGHKTL